MKVLITGASGALGRNLVENLKAMRDGKNRTRPNLNIETIYEYSRSNTGEDLDGFCSDCDFVVHAAGVNRPKDTSEFMEGNYGFTSTLLETLIPYDDHDERDPSLPSLRFVANEMGTTILKVRKLLITADYYATSTSRLIRRLIDSGCTIEDVMNKTGLGKASVYSYM